MSTVKEMPVSEKPREKAMRYGVRTLSNRELLALILRCGSKGTSVLELAEQLLQKAGGIAGLPRMESAEMRDLKGISTVKALELAACFELAARISCASLEEKTIIHDRGDLEKWLRLKFGGRMQEEFMVIYLNSLGQIISSQILFRGTIDHSLVSPREVFRHALMLSSKHIVLVHNHPCGSLTASEADLSLTARMIEAGRMMDVDVLDHLIVSQNGVLSIMHDMRTFLKQP